MKPTRDQGILVEGNLQGTTTKMTIDTSAMQHIMAVLTDLYSDPEYAVLREYSTNAIDAHVEAGVTDPIEVDLPTPLSPFLKVRDNGVGLTQDDIEAMYSKYGASSKRGTNEQTGMLGLGSKSALTYAQQFTIIGRKDGWKISVAVSRSDEGGGEMTVVNRMETSEPNGVEIVIPFARDNGLEEKADKLFKYWPAGTVKVNGSPPDSFRDNALEITPNIFLVEDNSGSSNSYYSRRRNRMASYYETDEADDHVCVMGNVPYPMKLPNGVLPHGTKMVALVPIGAVNFTPSREALHYTNHTKNAIDNIIAEYRAGVNGAVQKAVDAADSHSEALAVVSKWSKYLTKSDAVTFTYKKDQLPSRYEQPYPDGQLDKHGKPKRLSLRITPTGGNGYGRLSGYSNHESLSAGQWPHTVWVEDFNPGDCTADHKRKLDKWVEDSGVTPVTQYVLLQGKLIRNKFIADDHVVSYPDTIRPIVLKVAKPANSWGETRIPGSYRAWTETTAEQYTGDQLPGDKIRQQHPIIYRRGGKYAGRDDAMRLKEIYECFTLVTMPENRIDKFKRIVPKAVTVSEAITAKRDKWENNLTDDQRKALAIHDADTTHYLRVLDSALIDDPDLTEAIRLANVKVDKLLQQRRAFGAHYETSVKWDNPLMKYPLLFDTNSYRVRYVSVTKANKQHIYLYLNCAYKDAKKGTQ